LPALDSATATCSYVVFWNDLRLGGGKKAVASMLDEDPALSQKLRAAITDKIKAERLRSLR
jgi:hypothetical protein